MNYPYNQHTILCKSHVRHVSQVSDLRPIGPLVFLSGDPVVRNECLVCIKNTCIFVIRNIAFTITYQVTIDRFE